MSDAALLPVLQPPADGVQPRAVVFEILRPGDRIPGPQQMLRQCGQGPYFVLKAHMLVVGDGAALAGCSFPRQQNSSSAPSEMPHLENANGETRSRCCSSICRASASSCCAVVVTFHFFRRWWKPLISAIARGSRKRPPAAWHRIPGCGACRPLLRQNADRGSACPERRKRNLCLSAPRADRNGKCA